MTDRTYRLNYTVASDRGLVRGNNEDSAYAGRYLLALADGMGGHAAGEVASTLMITHLERIDRNPGDNDMLALVGSAADEANASIADEIRRHPETEGMGTTLTALMFNGYEFGMCHVGDSRGYRLRNGALEQITVDDTYVQALVAKGHLDPEDVSTHPKRSVILKAYTGHPIKPSLSILDAKPGDRLLLCSDGLSDPVTAATIEENLGLGTPQEAAERLVALALRSGGPDNVTVVVADVLDQRDLSQEELDALPAEPMTAGALLGETEEESHPDTAAGRAAALRRRARQAASSPPVVPTEPQQIPPHGENDNEQGDTSQEKSSSWRWLGICIALVVLIALIGGGWWAYTSARNTYFVSTTGDDERIVVERGVNYSVFGHDMHSVYQQACLGEDASLQLAELGSSCTAFKLADLPESERSRVASLPDGSYEEITGQLRRLAESALPVCVTLPSQTEQPEHAEHHEQAQQTDQDKQRQQPGRNCREVK